MIRAEQDRAFMSTAELSRERQLDEAYTARLYRRIDELRHDDEWLDDFIDQHRTKLKAVFRLLKSDKLAAAQDLDKELERIAEAHARIDVKDED